LVAPLVAPALAHWLLGAGPVSRPAAQVHAADALGPYARGTACRSLRP
jgi:hypothetical protein